MTTNLDEVTEKISELKEELDSINSWHKQESDRISSRLKQEQFKRSLMIRSIDHDLILEATKIITISGILGSKIANRERHDMIDVAIEDVIAGCKYLMHHNLAVDFKNAQIKWRPRLDSTPTDVAFCIALTDSTRQRFFSAATGLTVGEQRATLYLLDHAAQLDFLWRRYGQ